jgi:hypothetical protein
MRRVAFALLSGAESLQTRWHRIIGAPAPEGWDNQLRNEPALQLNYRYERLICEYERDLGDCFVPRSWRAAP